VVPVYLQLPPRAATSTVWCFRLLAHVAFRVVIRLKIDPNLDERRRPIRHLQLKAAKTSPFGPATT